MQGRDVELAARWWQWAMAMPNAKNPVVDETGELAGIDQPADVWFLAGTFGGEVKRACTIPRGRPIFFPTFNLFQAVPYSLFGRPELPTAPEASGHAVLNGTPLPVREVVNAKSFRVTAAAGGPFGITGRVKAKAWGLWCSIDDLPPGDHDLSFGGEYQPGGFWVHAHYELKIV